MTVAVLTDIHPIPFFDEPTCECQSKKDGAGYQDTVTLKFLTSKQLPRGAALGFVVTDVNGNANGNAAQTGGFGAASAAKDEPARQARAPRALLLLF